MAENKLENNPASSVEERLAEIEAEYRKKLAELDARLANCGETEGHGKVIRDITKAKDDDYVEVRLFRDGDKYKDDVLVGVNGKMCQIARGVPVKVQRKFAKIISVSESESAIVNAAMASKDGKINRM